MERGTKRNEVPWSFRFVTHVRTRHYTVPHFRSLMRRTLCALILFFSALPLVAQPTAAPTTTGDPWWKHAVIYEVYPRSFQDSDGDGRGDIKGIESRLGYLKDLGIDAIWITPMYPSPQIDFGYDISDYEAIDPQYG